MPSDGSGAGDVLTATLGPMATTVTLTIADADAPRIVSALQAPNKYAPGVDALFFPPTGATNADIIKGYLVNICQQATLAHEGVQVPSSVGLPAIT